MIEIRTNRTNNNDKDDKNNDVFILKIFLHYNIFYCFAFRGVYTFINTYKYNI